MSAIFSRCPYMPLPTEIEMTASLGTDRSMDLLPGVRTPSPDGLIASRPKGQRWPLKPA